MKSALNELNFPTSAEDLMQTLSWPQPKLKLSDTKTLLSQLRFSLTNRRDVNEILHQFSGIKSSIICNERTGSNNKRINSSNRDNKSSLFPSSNGQSSYKIGNLVVTPSVSQVIDFITPWIASHESVLLIGSKGVGKNTILAETFFPQGMVVNVFCCPNTSTDDVINKIKACCSFTTTSTGKAMRASNGAKLILYFRNLEVLQPDQWNCVPVVAFLTNLLSQGGFYDALSLEWISLQNFLVVGTCTSIDCLDMRLLNRTHVCEVSLPPVQEIQQIIPSLGPTDSRGQSWKTTFAKLFCKIVQDMTHSDSDSGFMSSPPVVSVDLMRICREIICLLSRYEVVDEKIMLLQTRRVLINYCEDLARDSNNHVNLTRMSGGEEGDFFTGNDSLTSLPSFMSVQTESTSKHDENGNDTRITYGHASNFGCKMTRVPASSFKEWIKKTIDRWVSETESLLPSPVALIPETLTVFEESGIFLSEATPGIHVVLLLGSSASGRKLSLKVLAHEFAYDVIWSPRSKLTEKHLVNELKNFADSTSESSTGASSSKSAGNGSHAMTANNNNGSDGDSDKRILILLDEVHFQEMPFLLKVLYTFYQEETDAARKSSSQTSSSFNSLVIKVAIMKRTLSSTDDLIWSLRVASVRKLRPLSDDSLTKLPLLMDPALHASNDSSSIDEEFAVKFHRIFQLFPWFRRDNRRFLSLIATFYSLFQEKKVDTQNRRKEFLDKISKLERTRAEVEKLKSESAAQREVLNQKRREADEALSLITTSMTSSEDQKIELQVIKSRTENETAKLKVRKQEIDQELACIEPTLLAAKAAVGGIKSESLSEIRSLRAPPEVIRDILEGVLRLMGVNDTSWISMKSFLARRGVKEEIINFDARKISPDMSRKVEELMKMRPNSFDEKSAKRASAAAAPLAAWVLANLSFAQVLQKIKPLEDEQNKLESGLRAAQSRMKSLSNQLEGVEDQVGHLRNRLNQVTLEAAQTEVNLKTTAQTLAQSEALVQELSGEYKHWQQQLSDLDRKLKFLSVRCLISAALAVLMGRLPSREETEGSMTSSTTRRRKSLQRQEGISSSFSSSTRIRKEYRDDKEYEDDKEEDDDDDGVDFCEQEDLAKKTQEEETGFTKKKNKNNKGSSEVTSEQRNKLIKDCCQVLETEYFDVADFLGYSSDQEVFLRLKTPFLSKVLIDPKGLLSSNSFLSSSSPGMTSCKISSSSSTPAAAPSTQSSSSSTSLEVTSLKNRDWIRVVELSLRFGRRVILDNFERLDLSLLPLLKQHFYGTEGSRSWTFIGEKRVDLNPNFALFFSTPSKAVFPPLNENLMHQHSHQSHSQMISRDRGEEKEDDSKKKNDSLYCSSSLFNVIDFSSGS